MDIPARLDYLYLGLCALSSAPIVGLARSVGEAVRYGMEWRAALKLIALGDDVGKYRWLASDVTARRVP
ncbi:MAG TPA: hypothetical protein VJK51_04630 [Candidatus Nanoarchaeia archaeon]|nr:hypothetical protein [Candidatus Nanoarchaeia archaeon]